ncbi:four helix bundle protein [Patescibacteria group bacterium]
MAAAPYEKLRIWQESHRLALDVYKLSSCLPKEETYGLRSQMRRAACSVAFNIAEGVGRGTYNELRRFLRIARGSAMEVSCQTRIARDLRYLPQPEANQLITAYNGLSAGIARYMKKMVIRYPS